MANNVTLPGTGTPVETLDIGSGVERQVVTISPRDLSSGDSLGALTETAPATDTASSGLNGRLQRIAQRITSLIALLPAALGAGGGLKIDGSGTALPVSQSGTWRATATEKWIAGSGQGLTWGNAFSTEVNSITNGQAILSSIAIANNTALDLFADISIALGSITTGAGAPYIGFYLYPLNQDGSTYGDGRFASAGAGPPLSSYFVGQVPLIPSATQAQEGSCTGILLPPGSFKLVAYNQAGATLAASANTIAYRTYNRSVA